MVLAIIELFIGASIVPSISGNAMGFCNASEMHLTDKMNYVNENSEKTRLNYIDNPMVEWYCIFNISLYDECYSGQQTADGGYILTGFSYSYSESYAWLVKTDGFGNRIWIKTFPLAYAYYVQQTSDGGYILTGNKYSSIYAKPDIWLIKTDCNGDKIWEKQFGGTDDDIGTRVEQTLDGGFIIFGETRSFSSDKTDFWLIKTDCYGNEIWNEIYGGSDSEYCCYGQQTDDGGFIIAGSTMSFGSGQFDFWLIKTDCNGDKIWDRTYGGSKGDECHSALQTNDGGYILTGRTDSFGINSDAWIVKTDRQGNMIWNNHFGGREFDGARDILQTDNDRYIITGSSVSYGHTVWIIRTDENGKEKWNETFEIIDYGIGMSIQKTLDGGYIIAGIKDYFLEETDIFLMKLRKKNKSISKTYVPDSLRIGANIEKSSIINEPPNKPELWGTEKIKEGDNGIYWAETTDPEGDNIYYYFSFSDGTNVGWTGPYINGMNAAMSHTWNEKGNFEVKVKAMDEYGAESDWSDPLQITVPKSNTFKNILNEICVMIGTLINSEKTVKLLNNL